jgi:hypothetical protein
VKILKEKKQQDLFSGLGNGIFQVLTYCCELNVFLNESDQKRKENVSTDNEDLNPVTDQLMQRKFREEQRTEQLPG